MIFRFAKSPCGQADLTTKTNTNFLFFFPPGDPSRENSDRAHLCRSGTFHSVTHRNLLPTPEPWTVITICWSPMLSRGYYPLCSLMPFPGCEVAPENAHPLLPMSPSALCVARFCYRDLGRFRGETRNLKRATSWEHLFPPFHFRLSAKFIRPDIRTERSKQIQKDRIYSVFLLIPK